MPEPIIDFIVRNKELLLGGVAWVSGIIALTGLTLEGFNRYFKNKDTSGLTAELNKDRGGELKKADADSTIEEASERKKSQK